ncbi:acyl-CoA dehydrogenase family protein [Actinophytocola gossypii]|uniref:Acyl-[acyl-carrier-protein] dehydrogenase MbtN n=1 Tax=Actinophytocola gossypii TaxID=2812003 RepID=A0ABT2J322_9PSEU|nr:acyl-CoA dehydrogenase family protein [Actinophytocola gossypii]MCT2582247.1 acyl-CoA dehydrogenase family protein [Actinophytocola gossypii]
MSTSFYNQEHAEFRELARTFVARAVEPHLRRWDADGLIGREVWKAAAARGLLGLRTPEEYGGAGVADYRFRCVLTEELSRVGAAAFASGLAINEDIVAGYLLNLGSDAQRRRWLPGMAEGEVVTSIAMSEPGAGSDLRAISTTATRTDAGWVVNGSKTFITNGGSSDVVLVAARTGEREGRPRLSLLLVPAGTPGFTRGRTLDKLGLHAQDTAELFFDDVEVPADNLVGEEGRGFHHLTHQLPLERLSIAWRGLSGADAALRWTLDYVRDRSAFGQRVIDFQHTRFRLAELVTEVDVTRAYLEKLVLDLNDGRLDATTAAKAKWWATELQQRVVSACLQMHGGYGYMTEYPIARAFADARVQTIVGGTTEIMKEIIGRALAADRS